MDRVESQIMEFLARPVVKVNIENLIAITKYKGNPFYTRKTKDYKLTLDVETKQVNIIAKDVAISIYDIERLIEGDLDQVVITYLAKNSSVSIDNLETYLEAFLKPNSKTLEEHIITKYSI